MTYLYILLAFLAGALWGWYQAHQTVASECRKLGGFYVGASIFKCVEVKDPEVYFGPPGVPPRRPPAREAAE